MKLLMKAVAKLYCKQLMFLS